MMSEGAGCFAGRRGLRERAGWWDLNPCSVMNQLFEFGQATQPRSLSLLIEHGARIASISKCCGSETERV